MDDYSQVPPIPALNEDKKDHDDKNMTTVSDTYAHKEKTIWDRIMDEVVVYY